MPPVFNGEPKARFGGPWGEPDPPAFLESHPRRRRRGLSRFHPRTLQPAYAVCFFSGTGNGGLTSTSPPGHWLARLQGLQLFK